MMDNMECLKCRFCWNSEITDYETEEGWICPRCRKLLITWEEIK